MILHRPIPLSVAHLPTAKIAGTVDRILTRLSSFKSMGTSDTSQSSSILSIVPVGEVKRLSSVDISHRGS